MEWCSQKCSALPMRVLRLELNYKSGEITSGAKLSLGCVVVKSY